MEREFRKLGVNPKVHPKLCDENGILDRWNLFPPKNVLAKSFDNRLVISREGIIQGPFTPQEWGEYAHESWGLVAKLSEDMPDFEKTDNKYLKFGKNYKPDIRDLFFRDPDNFQCGSFNHFCDQWLITINTLPDDDDLKHMTYMSVWNGIDLFQNQALIEKNFSRPFRNKGNFHTKKIPHKFNNYVRDKLDFGDKNLQNFTPSEIVTLKDRDKKWFPRTKNIPKNENNGKPIFQTNPELLEKHGSFLVTEVAKNIGDEIMSPISRENLFLVSAWVVAEGKKLRKCFDGGLIKVLESAKTKCVLDSIPDFVDMLKPHDLLTKIDDKSGFYQLLLNGDSIGLTGQKLGNSYFVTRGAAFGLPRIPGDFQRANMCAVSFLQKIGVNIKLYLDDRGMSDAYVKLKSFEAPRNAFLTCLVTTAVGGYISVEKSELAGSKQMEFLGMDINTENTTITVPKKKWDKLMSKMHPIISGEVDFISLKDIERIRGLAISFYHAVPMARLYIRRMTETLKTNWDLGAHPYFELKPPPARLIEEFRWWSEQKYVETSKNWVPKPLTHLEVKNVYTDSSSFAGGACIVKNTSEQEHVFNIHWSNLHSKWAIHHKEALIIIKALDRYKKVLKNKSITLFTDNMAVFHGYKFGCPDQLLNDMILEMYHKCHDIGSTMKLEFVPTKSQLADEPSRFLDKKEEIFSITLFEGLKAWLNWEFQWDCMATSENSLCEKFIAKTYGDNSDLVNFLTITKLTGNLWVFPPMGMAKQVAIHCLKNFQSNNWCFIFHRFQEWSPAMSVLARNEKIKFVRLSTKTNPCTALPVAKRNSDCWHPYYKRNKQPYETWCAIFSPNSGLLKKLPKFSSLFQAIKCTMI